MILLYKSFTFYKSYNITIKITYSDKQKRIFNRVFHLLNKYDIFLFYVYFKPPVQEYYAYDD